MSVATVIETENTTTTAKPVMDGKTPATTRNLNHGTAADLDRKVAALRASYVAADKGETEARKAFDAADIAWQNSRVVKVRVAYAAAMLTPNKGAANLLAATRYLLTDPNDTPAKRTAAAKSRKNTLRNYVAAGEALQEAGLATRITEPDENERKIVADVFRELNKRDKDENKGKGEGEGDESGEGEGSAPDTADDEALTFVSLVGMVARMNSMLDIMAAGSVVISEREAASMADMLAGFSTKLAAYADGK